MSLEQYLLMMASGAAIVVLLSFMTEHLDWFKNLNPTQRWWTVFVVCFAVPLVGWGGLLTMSYIQLPATWQEWVVAVFGQLVIGATNFIATQYGHTKVNYALRTNKENGSS